MTNHLQQRSFETEDETKHTSNEIGKQGQQ